MKKMETRRSKGNSRALNNDDFDSHDSSGLISEDASYWGT